MTLLSAFLQGALVILVLMQMSQSLSFGEFQYCAYPSPIPLLLAALKLIHARRTRGCAPVTWHSSNHSGRSNNGFPRTFSLSPFALFFRFLLVHATSHFLLMRDAMWEPLLPAMLMLEMWVQLSLKSLSINQGQRLVRSLPCCILSVCHL